MSLKIIKNSGDENEEWLKKNVEGMFLHHGWNGQV
jgi:hypothetical protein